MKLIDIVNACKKDGKDFDLSVTVDVDTFLKFRWHWRGSNGGACSYVRVINLKDFSESINVEAVVAEVANEENWK